MKPKVLKTLLLCSVIAGMAGAASAQTFTATATVQNAVTITEVTPLDFGTVFATATAASNAAADETYSNKLTLSAAGAASVTAEAAGGPTVLSLGGATAGAFSAPGLPADANVVVAFTNASDLAVTPAASVALAECPYDTPSAALGANKVVLTNGADPATAFFCVDVFTSNRVGLFSTGYALGLGVTELTFNLGATLVAQAPLAGAARSFLPGAYTGTFGMEVTFP